MNVKILLERDEDGFYTATCPSLPGCISQGSTEADAIKNIKEAVALHLKCISEDGLPLRKSPRIKELTVNVGL
jgi:predicted RNase H-like HicB family nuclease